MKKPKEADRAAIHRALETARKAFTGLIEVVDTFEDLDADLCGNRIALGRCAGTKARKIDEQLLEALDRTAELVSILTQAVERDPLMIQDAGTS